MTANVEQVTDTEAPDDWKKRRRARTGTGLHFVAARWTIPALLIAYLFQGDVSGWPFVPRLALLVGLMAAIIAVECAFENARTWRTVQITGAVSVLVIGAIFGLAMFDTLRAQEFNQRRCLSIEKDMLSARPRRNDSHDLFSALGCKPQSLMRPYAPPTDREKRAGHPLPSGGYPMPE